MDVLQTKPRQSVSARSTLSVGAVLVGLSAPALVFVMVWGGVRAHAFRASARDGALFGPEVVQNASVVSETPSVLILYSEANFWGQQWRTELMPPRLREDSSVITSTQLQEANLLGRISSVRLRCGSRDSHVVLFTARNTSSRISGWTPSGFAYPISCVAGTTRLVNLHADEPRVADKVGSIYLVVHAPGITVAPFSELVENNWPRYLADKLPDGAKMNGNAVLKFVTPFRFTIAQELWLDNWRCGGRAAHIELAAQVWVSGPGLADETDYFEVNRGPTYVDESWGDAWGCRDTMLDKLREAGDEGAREFEKVLEDLAHGLVPHHSRYYLVPTYGLRNFWLVGGGARPE